MSIKADSTYRGLSIKRPIVIQYVLALLSRLIEIIYYDPEEKGQCNVDFSLNKEKKREIR